MKIRLFLTFDHELPLGGLHTSYEKAMFQPTQRVMDLADKYGVKVTLFSDVLCAYRFGEWDYHGFYSPYKEQLQYAIRNGHDVQLHTHPHWLTTEYDGVNFLPSTDFMLSDFKNDTQYGGIPGIISLSINHLKKLCKPASEKYECLAFRGGGLNVYPDTALTLKSLYDVGIRYDSSMAKGYYFKSGMSEVDYRKLPDSPNWMIDPDNYHRRLSDKQGILEVPIATIPKTLFETPTRFKLKKYAGRAVENRGKMIHQGTTINLSSKLKMLFSTRMLTFDNHTLSCDYLLQIVRYHINRYQNRSDEIMFSLISHPKSMGDYSFELMEGFISAIQKSYPNIQFTTFSEFHRTQQ